MIRVVLFEDNKNYREALEEAFEDSERVFITKSFEEAGSVISNVKKFNPDVILMDIEMPGVSGLDALSLIREAKLESKVLIQTQFDDDHRIFVALCRGAWGYALKKDSFDQIEEAIVNVNQGGGYFSPSIARKVVKLFQSKLVKSNPDYIALSVREIEVLEYLAQALKYKEIAEKMYLSYDGVHAHIKNIYKKMHVNSRAQAVLKAIESKIIS